MFQSFVFRRRYVRKLTERKNYPEEENVDELIARFDENGYKQTKNTQLNRFKLISNPHTYTHTQTHMRLTSDSAS